MFLFWLLFTERKPFSIIPMRGCRAAAAIMRRIAVADCAAA
jgi:hypothetical protein